MRGSEVKIGSVVRVFEYGVTTWHGESRTLFYVVRVRISNPADYDVIETHQTMESARRSADELNEATS